jgi:hypothetical protein
MLVKCSKGLGKGELKAAMLDVDYISKPIVNCFSPIVQPLVYYKAGADYHEFC